MTNPHTGKQPQAYFSQGLSMSQSKFTFTILLVALSLNHVVAEEVTVHQLYYTVGKHTLPSTPAEIEVIKTKPFADEYKDQGPVFVAETEELKGTVKLRRWFHFDSRRFFSGFELPVRIPGIDLNKDFEVYVWKRKAEGLVPVYCSTRPDGSGPFFTTDKEKHQEKIEEDWSALKIKRKNLNVVFWAKPLPD